MQLNAAVDGVHSHVWCSRIFHAKQTVGSDAETLIMSSACTISMSWSIMYWYTCESQFTAECTVCTNSCHQLLLYLRSSTSGEALLITISIRLRWSATQLSVWSACTFSSFVTERAVVCVQSMNSTDINALESQFTAECTVGACLNHQLLGVEHIDIWRCTFHYHYRELKVVSRALSMWSATAMAVLYTGVHGVWRTRQD